MAPNPSCSHPSSAHPSLGRSSAGRPSDGRPSASHLSFPQRTSGFRRPLALGAAMLALGALALPVMSGCSSLPYVIHAAVSVCKPLLTAILDDPVDTLPPQYRFCGSPEWQVRGLPELAPYGGIRLQLDGVPAAPDGGSVTAAGTAVRVHGDFDQVARYAAELGIRSLEFRDGNDAWSVEVNHEYAAIAIFRNAQVVEARFLLAPSAR
jgi:hypothetical protein